MSDISSAWTMLGLDLLMIIYTLWALSVFKPIGKIGIGIAAGMLAWLALLHFGLSTESLFPKDISGVGFLMVIFAEAG